MHGEQGGGIVMIQCFSGEAADGWFAGGLPRLLSASKIDSAFSVHPRVLHKHPDFLELLYVRAGTGVYIVDEQRYSIGAGDLVICNADCLHDEDPACTVALSMLSIAVTDVAVDGLPPNHLIGAGLSPVFPAGSLADEVCALLTMIHGMLANQPDEAAQACRYLTAALLARLLSAIRCRCETGGDTVRTRTDIITDQVKQYINTHFDEAFTLRDIADAIGISPYHLAHTFKEQTGYSPMQYTMRRRLGEAQSLLISTELPVTHIAGAVGFGNPCHFNTMFSKYVGMPPNKYRSQYVRRGGAD